MTRRTLASILGLTLVSLGPALAGCEPWPHNLRKRDTDPDSTRASAESDGVESTKILDVQAEPGQKKPFFKSSRLSGGLSSESREIESHFGIQ